MFSALGKKYIAENEVSFDYWHEKEVDVECKREKNFDVENVCVNDGQQKNLWQCIVDEYEQKRLKYTERQRKLEDSLIVLPHHDGQSNYLNTEIFPFLLPAMEKALVEAQRWDALQIQKCRFNGLDYLAEILWNRNTKHPKRALKWYTLFEIPQFKLLLRLNPRPIFPISWLLTKSEAVLHIQRYIRGWLVRKRDDVQEMRQFWKAIVEEKANITKS